MTEYEAKIDRIARARGLSFTDAQIEEMQGIADERGLRSYMVARDVGRRCAELGLKRGANA